MNRKFRIEPQPNYLQCAPLITLRRRQVFIICEKHGLCVARIKLTRGDMAKKLLAEWFKLWKRRACK